MPPTRSPTTSAAAAGALSCALMNAKARELGLRDTHFCEPGRARPGRPRLVRARRDGLARVAMRQPFVRASWCDGRGAIAGGRALETWNDLLDTFPGLIGVKTGHTNGAGWSEVAAARGPGFVDIRDAARRAHARPAQRRSRRLLAWGISRYRGRAARRGRRGTRLRSCPTGEGAVELVAARSRLHVVRLGPLVRAGRRAGRVALPVRKGQRARRGGVTAAAKLIARRRSSPSRRPSRVPRRIGWYAGETLDHVWGWFTRRDFGGHSRDRHRHHERRARPDAHRAELPARPPAPRQREAHARGRQGDHRRTGAQAARRACRRYRPRRGRNGRRILEELAEEAILNDFVRIDDESRRRLPSPIPRRARSRRSMEWGPLVEPGGAGDIAREGRLPRPRGRAWSSSPDRYRVASKTTSTPKLSVRSTAAVSSRFSTPRVSHCASGWRRSRFSCPPTASRRRRSSVRSSPMTATSSTGSTPRGHGARNALITFERGCFASVRGERRHAKRFRAEAPHLEAVSSVGSGAVLLAGFIAAWLEDPNPEDALRKAVAAGAASTLEVGAGRFDPRGVGRILPDVLVAELRRLRAADVHRPCYRSSALDGASAYGS